ncbi:hypothetical protein D9M72_595330 [compost metagenome]
MRWNTPEHNVAISYRQRPSIAISRRAGNRPCGFRADLEACAIETQNRPTACRDGVDHHDRRTDTSASDLALSRPFEMTSIMPNVSRGAAHIEADDVSYAGCGATGDCTHNSTRGTG